MTSIHILLTIYLAGVVVALFWGGFWWQRLNQFMKVTVPTGALFWPVALTGAAVVFIGFIPFWLGRKSREWAR